MFMAFAVKVHASEGLTHMAEFLTNVHKAFL